MLIDHLESGFSYESFGAIVDTHKDTLYHWELKHPEFFEAKRIGASKSMLFWEKLGTGGAAGRLKGFNAAAWIFSMKNRFKWSDSLTLMGDSKNPATITLKYKVDDEDEHTENK